MPWSLAGFVALGFLIGTLVGLSTSPVTSALVGLLFAFAGGSAVAFFKTLTPDERSTAGQAVLGLSLGCLLGLYSGIVVSEFRLLSPPGRRPGSLTAAASPPSAGSPGTGSPEMLYPTSGYTRSGFGKKANEINARYRTKELAPEAAFDSLYQFVVSTSESTVDAADGINAQFHANQLDERSAYDSLYSLIRQAVGREP